jgi:hypothetical protein
MSKGRKDDRELAERLFPVYVERGTVEAVHKHCQKEGIAISKPTLHAMADLFFWARERGKIIQQRFAASGITGDPAADLVSLLTAQKEALHLEWLKDKASIDLNKALGTCIGQLIKAIDLQNKKSSPADPRRIAGDVLEQLVEWLGESGHTGVAHELSSLLPLFAKERL